MPQAQTSRDYRHSWTPSVTSSLIRLESNDILQAHSVELDDDESGQRIGGSVELDLNRNNAFNRSQQNYHSMREISGSVPQFNRRTTTLVDILTDNECEKQPFNEANSTPILESLRTISAFLEELYKIPGHRIDKRKAARLICETFYTAGLFEPHHVTGEDIVQILRFTAGIPVHKKDPITNGRQERKVRVLRTAVFKECGFSAKISIFPLICVPCRTLPKKLLSNEKSSPGIIVSKLLKLQRTDRNREVYLDESGRVYKSTDDWMKTNQFVPAIVYIPEKSEYPLNYKGEQYPYKIRQCMTPSCSTSKKALEVVDIVVGIGIVSAGAACIIASAGLATIPIVAAGQLVGSVYLGVRSSLSILDLKRHKPKTRN